MTDPHGPPIHAAPLDSALATGRWPSIREPRLLATRVYWLEQRPREGGRATLMVLPLEALEAARSCRLDQLPGQEITPAPCNLRSRVHDYGGGVVALHQSGSSTTVVWVDDRDGCLWLRQLLWPGGSSRCELGQPTRLCSPAARCFADGLIDARCQRWIGVMESEGADHLVGVPLAGGEPELLRRADAFLGYAALSPGGSHLCWIEWETTTMPWEASRLHIARFEGDGRLSVDQVIAGGTPSTAGQTCSLFQPVWQGNGDLVVANDRSGFWNLERLAGAEGWQPDQAAAPIWDPLIQAEEEFAMPQWTYGMRTTTWDGTQLITASCRKGQWRLGAVAPEGGWRELDTSFDDLSWLDGEAGDVIAVAASPRTAPGLLHMHTSRLKQAGDGLADRPTWSHHPCASLPVESHLIREPEAIWFPGSDGRPTHAWYHPPAQDGPSPPPLLVKVHSGPTSMARREFSPTIQFWTSRGWAVVDVNYGGSTGFGRAYRQRLDGEWGVVDVQDCAAAASFLIDSGLADPDRIAMEGGSAGGFTTLACLAFTTVFRAGACRYPVCDPSLLAQDTHRFEARYLDGLIGPWPQASAVYDARSPLQHVDRISVPVILFQGLQDRVVPPVQSERMTAALRDRGVPVELHCFPEEGHGFRDSTVQRRVLEATEAFFHRHLTISL